MFFYQDHHHHPFERTARDTVQDDVITPSSVSRQDDYPSPMYQFSPPMLDHDGFEDLLFAPHLVSANGNTSTQSPSPPPLPWEPCSTCKEEPSAAATAPSKARSCTTRKRATRKDRHSKIVTAKGTRDRRMRLSLDVAKKFFHLQDVLGFDKASKTVEWLLANSAKAIMAVTACSKSRHLKYGSGNAMVESSAMECEDNWRNDGKKDNDCVNKAAAIAATERSTNSIAASPKPRRPARPSMNIGTASDPLLAKKSRLKARAKARERTMEKQTTSRSNDREYGNKAKQLGSSSCAADTICEDSATRLAAAIGGGGGGGDALPPMDAGESAAGDMSMFHYKHSINDGCDTFSFFQDNWNMYFLGSIDEQ